MLVFGVEHAMTLKETGWARRDIQEFIIEQTGRPLSELIRSRRQRDAHRALAKVLSSADQSRSSARADASSTRR